MRYRLKFYFRCNFFIRMIFYRLFIAAAAKSFRPENNGDLSRQNNLGLVVLLPIRNSGSVKKIFFLLVLMNLSVYSYL